MMRACVRGLHAPNPRLIPHHPLPQIRRSRAEHNQVPVNGGGKGAQPPHSPPRHFLTFHNQFSLVFHNRFSLHARTRLLPPSLCAALTLNPHRMAAKQMRRSRDTACIACALAATPTPLLQAMFNLANNLKAAGRNADAVEMCAPTPLACSSAFVMHSKLV